MAANKTFARKVCLALQYRWLQVLLATVLFGIEISISAQILVPKAATKESIARAGGFKYMHCDTCGLEVLYTAGKDNTPVAGCRCKKPVVGYWVASIESQAKKVGPPTNPRKWFYTAVLLESLVYLFMIYYLLSKTIEERVAFYLKCIHCGELLRYGKTGFGVFVKGPNCQNVLKLPDEDESMTREDYEESMAESTVEEYQIRLRAGGYKFPGEETSEVQPDANSETANPPAPPTQ